MSVSPEYTESGPLHSMPESGPLHSMPSKPPVPPRLADDASARASGPLKSGTRRPRSTRDERAVRLLALTAALSEAATPDDIATAVVRETTTAFDATGTVVTRVVSDGTKLEIMQAGAMPPDVLDTWRRFPLDTPVPLADVARTGVPLFLESREDWLALYPHTVALLDATGHQSHMVAPLVVGGRAIGALGITFDRPRRFSATERTLAIAIARQCALALERARLFAEERDARAEAELARAAAEEARARADEANEAKTRFLTTMSHELRTPLNAIAGYTALLAMEVYGPVSAAQSDALARIERNQRHLLGLISDVLDYAKVDAGGAAIRLRPLAVAEVLPDVEALIAPQVQAKRIEYRSRCAASVVALADPERLRQIVLNLVSNAVKFTPEGGRVDLEVDCDTAVVSLRVRDTGIGIPPEERETVFEPFVQLGRDLASRHEGTGLGLAISRELARLMGGDITVQSVVGVGSEFVLTLPAGPALDGATRGGDTT